MVSSLWTSGDWNFDLIYKIWNEIDKISNEMSLSYYPPQIEIIGSEQMLDAYTSVGMPVYYKHWSFGKQFVREQKNYQSGQSGLAYEIVINSDPLITYLMEDNTTTTQALVLAHSISGHGHFFKNNYLFKQWTDAGSIIDYLIFARDYIAAQETKHGRKAVEEWLDSCHALMDYGVNRYKRPSKLSMEKEKAKQKERSEYLQSQVSDLYRILPKEKEKTNSAKKFPAQPEENLLYFFEKYSPDIENWQREILRIVRKIAQYFYPQGQTRVMNEGFASYVHYQIMNTMHDRGMTTDGSHLEFLALHTNVLYQPGHNSKYYSGINPYKFGFAMLEDIERMCSNPTAEDLAWFPQLKGQRGWDVILDSVVNFRDESFIRQWLSPKIIRDFKFFSVYDDREDVEKYLVTKIHNDSGYEEVREKLADQYLRSSYVPQIEVKSVDRKTRCLTLLYTGTNNRTLGNGDKMLAHIKKLWGGYPVVIVDQTGSTLYQTV